MIANPSSIPYFIGLSVLSTAIAYLFYSIGLKTVSAGKASMLSALEIVVATIVGIVVYSVNAGILGYIGLPTPWVPVKCTLPSTEISA